jgi:deazaflavin-dependent oxidoreductase (nitroreductase family)
MSVRLSRAESVFLYLHRTLDKRFNRLAVALFRRTRGGIARPLKVDVLALTTTGRRSGKARSVLLQYFRDGEDLLLVAADGGSDHHPAWYHNLRSTPDARVEIDGRHVDVYASELDPAEREQAWPAILERAPDYERYRRATDRVLPLVRLRRLHDRSGDG